MLDVRYFFSFLFNTCSVAENAEKFVQRTCIEQQNLKIPHIQQHYKFENFCTFFFPNWKHFAPTRLEYIFYSCGEQKVKVFLVYAVCFLGFGADTKSGGKVQLTLADLSFLTSIQISSEKLVLVKPFISTSRLPMVPLAPGRRSR